MRSRALLAGITVVLSLTAALLERAWSQARPLPTTEESRRITDHLIEEMAATARAHGAGFSDVLLAQADDDPAAWGVNAPALARWVREVRR